MSRSSSPASRKRSSVSSRPGSAARRSSICANSSRVLSRLLRLFSSARRRSAFFAREIVIAIDEAVEQAGQLLAALGQLRDLVLAEDLDTRQHVRGREIGHLATIVSDQRRVRDRALDAVIASRRALGADQERDLSPAL